GPVPVRQDRHPTGGARPARTQGDRRIPLPSRPAVRTQEGKAVKPDIPASDDGVTGPVDLKAAAPPWWPDVLAAAGADPAEREDRLDDLVLRDGSLTPDRAS